MKKNVDVKREGVVEKLKKSQSLLSMVQMLERNNSLCFKYMSCIIFDLSDVSLCPLKWKTKVFQQNGRKKDMHSILHEDAILEKEKKKYHENSSIFGQNKFEEEEKRDKVFENFRTYIEYFFQGSRKVQQLWPSLWQIQDTNP